MMSRLRIAVIAGAAAVSVALTAPRTTLRASDAISIAVAVTRADGEAVAGLTKDDFELSIDNTPTVIESLSPPGAAVTMVVLFDASASVTNYGNLHAEIERSIVPALGEGDRVRIGAIARRLLLGDRFNSAPRDILADGRRLLAVGDDEKTGPSPIWDAIDTSIRALESEPGRRAILIASDGRATGDALAALDVVRHAVSSGVIVQALVDNRQMVIAQGGDVAVSIQPWIGLKRLAAETGGLCLPEEAVPSGTEMPKPGPILTRLVKDLRQMYTLGVTPPGPPGSFHRVAVRSKLPDVVVRSRLSFQTPEAKQP
jgi:hypothetical protein